VQDALRFTRKLDKLPLPCKSAPGFVVNRILTPYVNEAIFAMEGGIPAPVIDRICKGFGMPMGPIELTDVVGLDDYPRDHPVESCIEGEPVSARP
jgi:3-hydroxyacyl-CoA dehydrogenase/enoyl-CoA hydratase/3-hydroxybutyryl-CoA epimerase